MNLSEIHTDHCIRDFASRYSILDLFLLFAPCLLSLRRRPLYFVVLFPRRYAVVKLDETRYRIERAITTSSRVGARLLTRLYIAERLNCTVQRELTPAKTASSSDAPRGGAAKNNRQKDANREKKSVAFPLYSSAHGRGVREGFCDK